MAQAQGALARISYVAESTYGTTPGSPTMKYLKAATYGAKADAVLEEIKSNAINALRAVDLVRTGAMSIRLSIPFELPVRGLSTLLYHLMGSKATSGAGPYTHVLKRAALPTGLSIEYAYTDIGQYFVYAGCKIDKMTLQFAPTGLVKGTLDLIAKTVTQATSSLGTPTAVTHLPYASFEGVMSEGGSTLAMQNMNLTITNDLSSQPQIGSRYIQALTEGKGECTGDITFLFQDATIYAKWLAETSSSLQAAYTNGSYSMTFKMSSVLYADNGTPGIPTDKGIVHTQKFRGTYNSSDATDLLLTIISDETTI